MSTLQTELIEEKVTGFVKRIQRRNKRNLLPVCALIIIFAFDMAYQIHNQRENSLLIIGNALSLFGLLLSITIFCWKLRIPKSEVFTFPPTQFPGKWKNHLTNQAHLLRLSWLWYLLPLFLGISTHILNGFANSPISLIILLSIQVFSFIKLWLINLQDAKQIERDRDAWFGSKSVA